MGKAAERAERVHGKWPTAVTPVATSPSNTDTIISYVSCRTAYHEYPQASGILTLPQRKRKMSLQPQKALTTYSGDCQ